MKKTASTKEEILILLASKGDAAAFYTLAAPYFEIDYLNLRHNGSTHNDAVEKILPDSSVLFRKIIGERPADFDEWFKNNSEISINESEEVSLFTIDKNLAAQRKHFLSEIQLHLLRIASEFNKKKRKKFLEILRNPRTKLIFGTTAVLIFLCSFFFLLLLTNSSVMIGFKHAEKEYSFVIGSASEKTAPDSTLLSSAPKADSTSTDSTAVKDTVISAKVEEKAPEPPPVKKVYRPKVVTPEQPRVSHTPPQAQSSSPSTSTESPAAVVEEPSPSVSSGSSAYTTPSESSSEY